MTRFFVGFWLIWVTLCLLTLKLFLWSPALPESIQLPFPDSNRQSEYTGKVDVRHTWQSLDDLPTDDVICQPGRNFTGWTPLSSFEFNCFWQDDQMMRHMAKIPVPAQATWSYSWKYHQTSLSLRPVAFKWNEPLAALAGVILFIVGLFALVVTVEEIKQKRNEPCS